MNFYDSELVGTILGGLGHVAVAVPERADLILLNTCSVREHAEQRVLGRVGELKRFKKRNPRLILGVLGCMSQRMGREILEQSPHVDLVVGPDAYRRLPELLARVESGETPVQALDLDSAEDYGSVATQRGAGGLRAWMAVQRGCNFGCTYCIVPKVRGRERYRPIADLLQEMERLVATGTREVCLLGQTVNAYRDGDRNFGDLLRAANGVVGLYRVRYTTSHPLTLRSAVFGAMAECDKVCEFLHLPVQAGSDRILKAMRRGYTAEEYLEKIEDARRRVPGLAVATDIIVGYPTETQEEFQQTLDVVTAADFDMVYPFKFSARPGTPAAEVEDDVPESVKQQRLAELIRHSRKIAQRKNAELKGSVQEVLVEGRSDSDPPRRLTGRTRTNKPVHFHGPDDLIGSLVPVRIQRTGPHSLQGDLVDKGPLPK
jgi:tRNA-2-methylthio-N6-dimethylallyladenosine synthase